MSTTIFRKGDVVESAMWYRNPKEKKACRLAIMRHISQASEAMILAPIEWSELSPEHERCPEPPPDAERGIMLLVGEAEVKEIKDVPNKNRFVDQLGPKDLLLIRNITRSIYMGYNQGEDTLSDDECDLLIETMGPDAAVKTMREMH